MGWTGAATGATWTGSRAGDAGRAASSLTASPFSAATQASTAGTAKSRKPNPAAVTSIGQFTTVSNSIFAGADGDGEGIDMGLPPETKRRADRRKKRLFPDRTSSSVQSTRRGGG